MKYDENEAVGNSSDASLSVNWGIYDTTDNCWMGDQTGPKLFADRIINGKLFPGELQAQIAAQMCDMQLGRVARCRARVYDEPTVRFKDDVKTRFGPEEALKRLEEGRLT